MSRKAIALDAGHYYYTPGRRCMLQFDPNETREWVLNSNMAEHVEAELAKYDCSVLRIDDRTGENQVTLAERNRLANAAGADYLLSIHHNGGIKGGNGGGIVVYVLPNADTISKQLQRAVYEATVKKTGLKGNRANPLATGNYSILSGAKQTAILGEYGFMDSRTDVPIIITDEFSSNCAAGIVEGLVSVAGLKKVQKEDNDMAIIEEIRKMYGLGDATEKQVAQAIGYILQNSAPSGDAKREYDAAKAEGITDGSNPGMPATRWMSTLMSRRAMGRR